MSVFRRQHNSNFTTISNRLFDDDRLAADELGILAFLISRPQDWEVRRPALMRRWGIGIVAMKRIVHSWMRTGWCQAAKVRMPNGQFYIEYRIYDLPGREMSDDEIREALSLVSSEVLKDGSPSISADDEPVSEGEPPPCQPGVVDQPLAGGGWLIKDIPTNELPRTDFTKKPEREGARVREKHALNLAEFKRRWPTNASDDQSRVDSAWWALSNEDGEAALIGISPFLENMKRNHRKHPPAGFNYLSQKRWELLEASKVASHAVSQFAPSSREGRAISTLFDIAGKSDFFRSAIFRGGTVNFRAEIDPQLLLLVEVGHRSEWAVHLTYEQAGAWNRFISERLGDLHRHRLVEGALAPKPWPPNKKGEWPPPTSKNPETLMSDDDAENFK